MSVTETDLAPMLEGIDAFLRRHLPPEEIRRRDEGHIPPYDLIPGLRELGVIRAPFPESLGGLGIPWSAMCRIQGRIARHAFFVASIVNRFVCFGAMPVMQFGSEAQKSGLLPAIIDARTLVVLALTEPEAGSDARAVRTRAEPLPGGGWRITGRKTWISDAGHADYLLTLCRTKDEAGGKDGYTAFLVPRRSPGIAMTVLPKIGNNCMPSYDIGYDGVEVADSDRLGAVGAGFDVITGTLKYSRASVASGVIGTAEAAVELARTHALERRQFGRALAEFQALRHRIVDMHLEVTKARLLVQELARAIDAGEPAIELGAAAKLVATDMLQYVTHHGMQILASAGYAAESPMQRYWRDARLYTFGEGTNEIQREIIAREMGLAATGRRKDQGERT